MTDDADRIEVRDNGRGIPPDGLPLIFHRFYRVERRSGGGATGMGLRLAIVERVARAHGGTIAATSELRAGSAFHIRIPTPPRAAILSVDQAVGGHA